LGALYRDLGRATEAEECCRRSIQLVPTNSDVHNNLANALGDLGRPLEAETFYKRALEIQPSNAPAHSNLLFLYAYFGMCSGERYLEHAKGWERAVIPESARLAARTKAFTRAPRAGRELRVGYVSGDFREHAVSCFMEQVFEAHDRKRFRLFAYPTSGVHDSTTDRMQRLIPEWHSLLGLNTDEALQMIEGHHIDVLIDLSGHTAFNRMDVFARRAAPVQCQYLGYFASTGLTEMDYFIADRDLVPASHDGQYSEQVWRLPRVWASYKPPEEVPAAEWRPDPEGKVWFGSFNHLGKVTPYTIEVWARLLRRVPHACLLLKTKELDDPQNRRRLVNAFAQHGIAGSRIELLGRTPDWKAHMRLYNRLDVALDPVGGNGGATTTCDALWMGVPVVTIAGARYGERMSHSILSAIGRGEWSTANESEYIERAAEIAADPRLIGYVRATQREAIRHTPLVDPQGMARALEDAYDAMFDRWLVRRPT
jgi:predicted O-linked N-acetylglucosamine transferase (SPINDLY family)